MKNILFCGTYIPKEISHRVENSSEAANNFQHELIKRLKKNNNVNIMTYISYKVFNIKELEETFEKYRNSYVIKSKNYISTIFNYYKTILSIIIKNNIDVVILYNLTYINLFIDLICRMKNIKSVLIIADFTDVCECKGFVRKAIAKITKLKFKKFSHRIVLSSNLYNKLQYKNTILLQGGINIKKYKDFTPMDRKKDLIILYAGALEEVTGVDILLDSIQQIPDDNLTFIISGRGSLVDQIKLAERRDKRIKYVGFLEESEFIQILSKAHILINPRNMNLDQNNNNFPSKILEYLATGKPIISTKFSGYDIFKDYILFTESSSDKLVIAINNMIQNYNKIYINTFLENRQYAINYDWDNQVEKIERFIIN